MIFRMFKPMSLAPNALFSALAHDTRLRSLILLIKQGELCVCELTRAIGAAQPHVSRHLAELRERGLVIDRRDGLWVYYRINPQLPAWVRAVLQATAEAVVHEPPYAEDTAVLGEIPGRPGARKCL
jgi:ArsR family transcriptional regulator